jgi:hypothetical protein
MMVTLRLWLHREEKDAWLVSLTGIGAGVWLPKSEIVVPDDAIGGLSGAVAVDMPDWLAEQKGLRSAPAEGQGSLFDGA